MSYFFWLGRDGERPTYTYYANSPWAFGDIKCGVPDHSPYPPVDTKTREDCIARFDMIPFGGFPKVA